MDKVSAQSRYMALYSDREDFLETAREAAYLTLPYLMTTEGHTQGERLHTPWQSVGAKGVNVLASKLMLSLFPINTSFFRLQISDAEIAKIPEVDETVKSEIDLSLSHMERMVMQSISETSDRVQLTAAMKHLVVTGNCLIFAGKKSLKLFPLDRYVIERDGDGNILEIITQEIVDRKLLPQEFQRAGGTDNVNSPGEDGPKFGVPSSKASNKGQADNAVVYTYVKVQDGQYRWHQECDDKIIPGTKSSSPAKSTPWMPLRFNVVDGESYGRGRVEEFIGDLRSLETLMQAMVQGSSAAAKVVFLVNPAATTKPGSLAKAQNGAIIQGRQEDVAVVQVGKTADFRTVMEMINTLTQRLADAFLVLQVRQSERTTATEVQAVQQELNEQLGGIYSSLTAELLSPYLARKLHTLSRNGSLPKLPKGLVVPTVVAGLYGVGRGQDRQALMEFVSTLAQGIGPEAMMQFINGQEFVKRLAAASGIEAAGLVKTAEEQAQEKQQMQMMQMQQSLMDQAGQLAKTPAAEALTQQLTNGQQQQPPGAEGDPEAGAPPEPQPEG